jgi:hypothetical protein
MAATGAFSPCGCFIFNPAANSLRLASSRGPAVHDDWPGYHRPQGNPVAFFISSERSRMMSKRLDAVLMETHVEQNAIIHRTWMINKIDKQAKQELMRDYRRLLLGRIR